MKGHGPASIKVCVIGAGVTGLSAAYELVRRGVTSVTVIDSEYVASGSSGRSVGMIESQYLERSEIELRALSMASFDEHEATSGLNIVRNGYLRLARNEVHARGFERSAELQRGMGLNATVLEPADLSKLVPDLNVDDIAAGLWGPRDGFIDGHLYANLLAERVQDGGGVVRVKTQLLGRSTGSTSRHRLVTSRGDIDADVVVNAAGAWGEEVGRHLGTRVALWPQRHQVVSVHPSHDLPYVMPSLVDYVPGSGYEGLSIRHETFDRMLATLHSEETLLPASDPHAWHTGIDDEFLERVSEHVTHRLPGLAELRLGQGWAGLYPVSPDGQPQVGPYSEEETVLAALGVGGFGIQVAPAVGRLVAEWIIDGTPRCYSQYEELLPGREALRGRSVPALRSAPLSAVDIRTTARGSSGPPVLVSRPRCREAEAADKRVEGFVDERTSRPGRSARPRTRRSWR